MRVRAKFVSEGGKEGRVVGYYGDKRVREGQIFVLQPRKRKDGSVESIQQQFSKKWMEQVDRMPVARPEPAKPQIPVAQNQGQLPPANNDPLGGGEPTDENIPSDDNESQTGSDALPGQPGGSNADVL